MNRVIFGDCRYSMRDLITDGIKAQMCVTSPPYWGLRDYGHSGQLGQEPTPAEYVANMVEVFRLVRELLADDGVLWLNLGDSYFSTTKGSGGPSDKQESNAGAWYEPRKFATPDGIKTKDLVGIPWMLAFALRADGWYLRQDIIWAKPNPMPESVTDRCTKSHEYLFLLAKSKRYYMDMAAIAEPATNVGKVVSLGGKSMSAGQATAANVAASGNGLAETYTVVESRNKRSVWTVATQPYSEAHFATFPPALIEPCILAGSRVGDVVLDPFFGSGTTGQVAQQLGRRWIGCELQIGYAPLQQQRTAQQGLELRA